MLLKSLNYWGWPGGLEGTLDPIAFMKAAKQCGYEAVELAIGDPGSALATGCSEAKAKEIREAAESMGLRTPSVASGLFWFSNLGDKEPEKRQKAFEDLEKMIRISSWLGAKTLLVIPGAVDVFFLPDRPAQPYLEVWENATEGLKRILPIAEKFQVRLGIENVWNKFLTGPGEMKSFIDQFQSPWIGAYVDVANLLPFGHAEDWLRTLGKHVVGIHFKDFRRAVGTVEGFVDLLEGDVNWPEVMKAIEEIGYVGPVVAELIPGYRHHPEVRARVASIAMDAILGRS